MSYLLLYEETFNKCCKHIACVIKESIAKTEQDLGSSMDDDTKKLCIGFALVFLIGKIGKE